MQATRMTDKQDRKASDGNGNRTGTGMQDARWDRGCGPQDTEWNWDGDWDRDRIRGYGMGEDVNGTMQDGE